MSQSEWSVLELATQYNVSKQIIFNYIKEMEQKKVKGYSLNGNQFIINQTGFNYILTRRESIKDTIKKPTPSQSDAPSQLEIELAVLKNEVEHLQEKIKDLEEDKKKLQYDLDKRDADLKESQADYKALTNKTIGLFLTDGTNPEPKPKKKHWWNRNKE